MYVYVATCCMLDTACPCTHMTVQCCMLHPRLVLKDLRQVAILTDVGRNASSKWSLYAEPVFNTFGGESTSYVLVNDLRYFSRSVY